MKKKQILLISAIVVIVLIIVGSFILILNKTSGNQGEDNLLNDMKPQINEQNGGQDETMTGNQSETNDTPSEKNKIVTDDFEMKLPEGWNKTPTTMTGVLALAVNPNEIINDSAAQKINFKSYLAVSSDTLQGKSMQEYIQTIKDSVKISIANTTFVNENDLIINGQTARAVEAEMTQQGANYKVLIVAIKGNNDNVWVLSYNTVKSSWDGYKEAFAESVKSFVLKK